MFFPEKMLLVNALFPDKYTPKVVRMIIHQGDLQIVDAAQTNPWIKDLARTYSTEESSQSQARREKVEGLVKTLKLTDQLHNFQPLSGDWMEIDQSLETAIAEIESVSQRRDSLQKEFQRLNEIKTRYDRFPGLGKALQMPGDYSYLAIETGEIPDNNLPLLEEQLSATLHVILPIGRQKGMTSLVAIVLKRDAEVLQAALKASGFQPTKIEKELPSLATESIEKLEKELNDLNEQLRDAEEKFQAVVNRHRALLIGVYLRIRQEQVQGRMLHFFRRTEKTCLFSGWLPDSRKEVFVKELQKATQNRAIVDLIPAESHEAVKDGSVEVPVKLNNPAFFKPFEMLTSVYGLAKYQTIDPTPVFGLSFLLMFGMMFGDIGHGLVLALLGLALLLKSHKDTFKSAGYLLLYAGGSSIIFGFLFGSFFGVEDLFPTIWMKPMNDINQLFKVVIYVGAGMITVSIIINLINGIRSGRILDYIFDKAGLLSGILYWCGIILVSRLVLTKTNGGVGLFVIYLFVACALLLFFREPILNLIRKNRRLYSSGVVTGLMHSLVEMLEIVLGFLANTVSFIRVGAFGLAHAGLFIAIFALSDMVSGKLSGVASILILILGNIFIIALEGLVVTIQAIRLEFYEFFNRFFRPARVKYQPIRENPNLE
ncbi:MAG TPA: V-type ATPase 116kDa subunit family protein [Candidatus Marinimicrobia bacterium]|nr:V-type ATPase 116kDa subunit family protein [Candidatus Neomarinimicrobiota bacterium]HQE95696.1 V-type ATPase 116kDa subunit family protein [Candidatus Neomarinimicrobiota bacterium]HQH56470.1 V-type ATPase 116kDa subunit family protein [Candidatus Neomarinimicrobiota bacterium]